LIGSEPLHGLVWNVIFKVELAVGDEPMLQVKGLQMGLCADSDRPATQLFVYACDRLLHQHMAHAGSAHRWRCDHAADAGSGPTPVDALVDGRKLRRGLKLWTVSVSTWKVDLYRRLWLGRGEAAEFPPGWVHLPQGIEVEWVKQLVAEQLHQVKDRRGFVRQEWAKLRDRNEALDCAVYARAAIVGVDRFEPKRWDALRRELSVVTADEGEEDAATTVSARVTRRRSASW
jgi:hypothetical protein